MPQVSSGSQELVNQILMLAQIMGRRKDKQADTLLGLAQPGQTAEQIGLTGGLGKRALGRDVAPTDIIRPHTAASRADEAERTFYEAVKNNPALLETAQPGDLLSIGASLFGSRAGSPGITTPQAVKTRAATATVKAKTESVITGSVLDRVQKGIESMSQADPAAQQALNETLAFGTTGQTLLNDQLKARMAAEATKRGIQFIANPNTHPLGTEFRKLGIDPVAAVAAIGTGSLGFLDNVARLSLIRTENAAQINTAMRTAQAQWAGRLSESIGGVLSPQVIAKVMDDRMSGKGRATAGPAARAEALIDQGMEMAYRAAVAKATAEGDPTIGVFKEIASAAANIRDDTRFKSIATEYKRRAGVLMQSQAVGPRPLQAGPEQTAWDVGAQQLGGFAPDIKSNKNWRDWLNTIAAFPGGDPNAAVFKQPADPLAPAASGVPPMAVRPDASALNTPQTPPRSAVPSIQDMSEEDKRSLQLFMSVIGGGQQVPTP